MKEKKKIIVKKRAELSDKNSDEDMKDTSPESENEHASSAPKFEESQDFERLLEESLNQNNEEITRGSIVSGVVVEIRDDFVFIDVGYKSEGKVDLDEFLDPPQKGDKVSVYVVTPEGREGDILLSKRNADGILKREEVEKAAKERVSVRGKVIKEIKGGFTVDLGGIEAFLPLSQLDVRRVNDPTPYLGNWYDFFVTRYERKPENIVLSRRQLLEEEVERNKKSFFENIKEENIVEGPIRTIMDYGIFVDLGPTNGFVHVKDISWSHVKTPKDVYKESDIVKAKVLKIDKENEKISLGIKQLTEDPWNIFAREHHSDEVVNGTVTRLADFGAFIKIADGVEGLIHIKDMSWTRKLNHPKEVLKPGDKIEAMIMDIDLENRRISLGLKQVLDNPWESIHLRYPLGKKVNAKVKKITNNGAFVIIDDEFEALLPSNELDWVKKSPDPKKVLKKGQEIEVVILGVDQDNQNITVGMKQLTENPYQAFIETNPIGSIVKGKVVRLVDFGAFIELLKNVEGLVHISNISKKRIEKPSDVLKVGAQVECVVIDYDVTKNKIGLSIKDYENRLEQLDIEKYSAPVEKKGATIGDFFKLDGISASDEKNETESKNEDANEAEKDNDSSNQEDNE